MCKVLWAYGSRVRRASLARRVESCCELVGWAMGAAGLLLWGVMLLLLVLA